jgi:DNA-binding Lrp family transcriptional regulator
MKEYSQKLDAIDRLILTQLQQDSAISNVELAQRISLSPPAVHGRIRRLEERGYIQKYVALLDREKVGYDLLCIISVSLRSHETQLIQAFKAAIQQLPEVLECFFLTGDHDFLLKVIVHNHKELEHFLTEKLTPIPGVGHISTGVVLAELKNTTVLTLDDVE